MFSSFSRNNNLFHSDIRETTLLKNSVSSLGSSESDAIIAIFQAILSHTGSIKNEDEVCLKLITPLLQKVLGYDMMHIHGQRGTGQYSRERIDYLLKFSDKQIPIEAEHIGKFTGQYKIKMRDNSDPIYQITNYIQKLNYHTYLYKQDQTRTPFGVLTDGLEWRLYSFASLRDTNLQPAFASIHLGNVNWNDREQANQALSLFTLLFGCESHSAGGILEQLSQENERKSEMVKEGLQKQVFASLECLCNGMYLALAKAKKDGRDTKALFEPYKILLPYSQTDEKTRRLKVLYHEAMVYLFRVIFGLYAEDRGLLDHLMEQTTSSEKRIRYGLKSAKLGEQTLFSYLQKSHGEIHGGESWIDPHDTGSMMDNIDQKLNQYYFDPLNVAYNGGLFSKQKHPLLDSFDINDRYFLRAMDYLMRIVDKDSKMPHAINFSTLDVKHLGTIYENLLAFSLVQSETDPAFPLLLLNDKGERKATGSYYTPDYIVEYIVRETLNPMIEPNLQQISAEEQQGANPPPQAVPLPYQGGLTRDQGARSIQDRIQKIISLKICDPAMGSGHFLVEVVRYLYEKINNLIEEELNEQEKARLLAFYTPSYIASQCIYGVDINYLAVELAKLVIWIKTFDPMVPLQFLDYNLQCGNSLIGSNKEDIHKVLSSLQESALDDSIKDIYADKLQQCVSLVCEKITTYIQGVSHSKQDIEKKYRLFEMLNKKISSELGILEQQSGDNLGISDYKERSKKSLEICQMYMDEFHELYPDTFADKKERQEFIKLGIAYYNIRYLANISLGRTLLSQKETLLGGSSARSFQTNVSDFLGKRLGQILGGGKTTKINRADIHKPTQSLVEGENSITACVDHIVKTINPMHWWIQFPTVFLGGGFDAVVGNPPYIRIQFLDDTTKTYINTNYQTAGYGNVDLYIPFFELALQLTNTTGRVGFIAPSVRLYTQYGEKLAQYILENRFLDLFVDFGSFQIFKEATTYTAIHLLSKAPISTLQYIYANDGNLEQEKRTIHYETISHLSHLKTSKNISIFEKLKTGNTLGKITQIFVGIQTSADTIYHLRKIKQDIYYSDFLKTEVQLEHLYMRPICSGEDIKRYAPIYTDMEVLFPYHTIDGKVTLISEKTLQDTAPKTYIYLQSVESALRRREKGKIPQKHKKQIIKANFKEYWKQSKKQIISILLKSLGTQNRYDSSFLEKLSNTIEFRNYFNEKHDREDGQTKWHGVLNGLDRHKILTDISAEFYLLIREIDLVLLKVEITDKEIITFLQRLQRILYDNRETDLNYGEEKNLSRFIWEIFGGWSSSGYKDYDIVEDIINKI